MEDRPSMVYCPCCGKEQPMVVPSPVFAGTEILCPECKTWWRINLVAIREAIDA